MNWEDYVRKVEPYTPGEQPKQNNIIKLNTNENPYPPAPGVEEALKNLKAGELRLYPDPSASLLTEALACRYGLKKEQVFVGVGSDDVIAMAFLTFFNSGKPIFFPDITYSFYDVWAGLYRIPYDKKPLTEDFKIHTEDYMEENGGIIFPNPNAPTGVLEDITVIEEILRTNQDGVVIIDEAYIDFGGTSCLPLLAEYDNLLVIQTFSKSRSMAGIRIGYAFGSEKLISYMNDVKFSFNSYTLNMPSLVLGTQSLMDEAYFRDTAARIIKTREWVKEELKELGFTFPDSWGNFIFAAHERIPARELFGALKKEGIFVRYFDKPRIDNHLRITIGTDDEMHALLAFLKQYMKTS